MTRAQSLLEAVAHREAELALSGSVEEAAGMCAVALDQAKDAVRAAVARPNDRELARRARRCLGHHSRCVGAYLELHGLMCINAERVGVLARQGGFRVEEVEVVRQQRTARARDLVAA